jgi:hypothetical protein
MFQEMFYVAFEVLTVVNKKSSPHLKGLSKKPSDEDRTIQEAVSSINMLICCYEDLKCNRAVDHTTLRGQSCSQ